VDEQAHIDLVVKYAQGKPPHGLEPFSGEAALYFALYRTPEYFFPPVEYGGQYPPPNWLLPPDERQHVLNEEAQFWESRINHETGEPPLYYAIAGAWFDLGRALGFRGLVLLYAVRFLNVAFATTLVWLGYKAALAVLPQQQFPALVTAALLAIWPQSSFYSVQGDSLSPVTFGFAFIALVKLLQSERPPVLLGVWLGLALAATCLIKTANLPLLFVVCIAALFKTVWLTRSGARQRGLSVLGGFVVAAALPLGIWFAWNQHYFGDLTATKSKIEVLGWTPKAFVDWWSHPIFTLTGAKDFWAELIASFWRGEFIWHGDRMATWWSDAFYWTASTIAIAVALVGLVIRRRTESRNIVLWFAFLSFASLVGFLILLSIRFDFGECPYPSRTHPYFTSGRLLNAGAVPFFLLFAYAIERIAAWTKREWTRWALLGLIAILVSAWQISINAPVFSSRYNFYHRPKS
jgi:Predicted membrane protein (DUF2142)